MKLVTTDAIVLRSYNLAEADRIVVCLTRSAGLVRAVAKGARRMKSRFGAALEPFTLIRLSFHERENRDLVSVSNAEILKSYFNLNSRVESAELLAYMGELVAEFAPPHEADERLFRMLAACIESLAATSGCERSLMRYFEVWLLRLAGLFPDLNACVDCGRPLESIVEFDVEFKPYCEQCGRTGAASLSVSTLASVRAVYRLAPAKFVETEKLSERDDAQLGDLTHRLITRAIERLPRTMMAVNG
jgi:DNA repair protein RecO (recombination protein O)